MSLYVIADTHLSFSTGKTMNVFSGWDDYEIRLEKNWRALVKPEDTVVIPGDVSWCMNMEDGLEDFRFLNSLPGRKILMKGNHDYWWSTKKKADDFFKQHSLDTLNILHNNAYECGSIAICGTRGWFFDAEKDEDKKIILREAGRLRASIAAAKQTGLEPVVFLHYPPLTKERRCDDIYSVLTDEGIKRCYYGHLHSYSHLTAYTGVNEDGIDFRLISGDYLGFIPAYVPESGTDNQVN
ncbi:MAG: metallophosphoesterase [Clostridia bacterium]|nr:metallophosphoesterase [Clostridia bacterium]